MTGKEFLEAKAQADAIRRMTEQLARDDAMCEEINKILDNLVHDEAEMARALGRISAQLVVAGRRRRGKCPE